MNGGAQRLRARSARRLVARYVAAGGILVLGGAAGWAVGLSVSTTVATLSIGLPAMALIQHFAMRENERRRGDRRMRWQAARQSHSLGASLARSRRS